MTPSPANRIHECLGLSKTYCCGLDTVGDTDTVRADTPIDAASDTTSGRKKNILGQVREALRSNPRGHSPLFLWMRAHHDDLVAEFSANPPNWQQLAQIFHAEGLTDRTGKAPSAAMARLTWYRVRQAAAQAKAEAKRKPPVTVPPIVATIPLPSPPPPAPWLLAGSQAGGPGPAPAASDGVPAAGPTVAERLRAFRASLNEGKVRIPEPINPAKSRGKTDGET
jgi:hypothetical protein